MSERLERLGNRQHAVVAMLALWLVGQLAAYGPARRAAGIEPATATRSV